MHRTLAFVIALASAHVARAQDVAPSAEAQSEYYKVSASAIVEFDEGRFAESRALFLRAHELWPSARTWRTLGMTAFELRMYPHALQELQTALQDTRRPLEAEQRAQVEDLLGQTRAFVGRYRLHIVPANATVVIDSAPVTLAADSSVLLAVGEHELLLRAPGHRELRLPLRVQGREDEQRTFELEPSATELPPIVAAPAASPRARWLRPASWSVSSVAAASLITGAALGGVAIAKRDDLDHHCPQKACPEAYRDDRDSFTRVANASTATLVVGGVLAATASYLWLRDRHERRARKLAMVPFGVIGSF